ANVDAYLSSVPQQESEFRRLALLQKNLSEEKARVFNPLLKEFDARVQIYRKDQSNFAEYVRAVTRQCGSVPLMVARFLEALQAESSIDLKRVESERSRFLSTLTERLTSEQIRKLTAASLAYREGNLSHAGFYAFLESLRRDSGVALAEFPTMDAYIHYIVVADQIDGDILLAQLQVLEQQKFRVLTKNSEEASLIRQSRELYLLGKLLNFSLTRDEWNEYVKTKSV